MDNLALKTFVAGELATNCYLVFDKKAKVGFLIDAPAGISELTQFIAKEKITVQFIVLTHAHFDHIGGLKKLARPFYLHRDDFTLLKDSNLNGAAIFNSPVEACGDPLPLGGTVAVDFDCSGLSVLHTPGHTPGSVCIKFHDWLFSGDTIFFGSVGRTDTPMGSQEALLSSINEKILTLPDSTVIYPGHGPKSSVARERKENPFLSASSDKGPERARG